MNNRRRLVGTVVNSKTAKTVTVEVSRTYKHPLYRKVVRSSKTYKVHDVLGASVGDKVSIVECAPVSRTKRWAVEEILRVEVRDEADLEVVSGGEEA